MLERPHKTFHELDEITIKTDTRDILSHATKQAERYEDYFLVDIDAHVSEITFWPEIIARVENDVIRQMAEALALMPGAANLALLNFVPGMLYQPVTREYDRHFIDGGRARADRLSSDERKRIAKRAAAARWKKS
jgi:hypothetical protein